jgi:hypothetical protein
MTGDSDESFLHPLINTADATVTAAKVNNSLFDFIFYIYKCEKDFTEQS